ncbi:MAG: hypothetical protein ABIK68_23600 [bacterium]
MRLILAALFIALLSTAEVEAGNGSFLILKRVYFYVNAGQSGKKELTRTQKAYDVIDVTAQDQKPVMYQIVVKEDNNVINGTGYIVETEAELQKLGPNPVKVYAKVLGSQSDFTGFLLVSPNQLSFTGRQEQTRDFPYVIWKAVNYKTSAPKTYWVPDWSGIYRPDKTAAWLNQTYQKANRLKLNENLMHKILLGLVETGYTREQVELTLGNPQERKVIENATQEEWQYEGRKVIFKSNRVLRVL